MTARESVVDREGAKASAVHVIMELAAAQHTIVTIAQLLDAGFTRRMVYGRVRAGWLHQVHRGVFAVGCAPTTQEAHWMAAVLACGPLALLSHVAAAALHGIRESAASVLDVTAPNARGRGRPGLRVHRSSLTEPGDLDEVRRIPVTSLPRTIIDLGTAVGFEALEYAIHRAESRRIVDLDALRDRLRRMPPNHRGAARVRSIIGAPLHELEADARSRSERLFLRICRRYGMQLPAVNRWIPLPIPSGGLEVDFCWPQSRLVVEVDEQGTHGTHRARRNDPARDRALVAAGWRPIRFPDTELERRPAGVAAEVTALLVEATGALAGLGPADIRAGASS